MEQKPLDDKPIVLIVDDTATNVDILAACLTDNYRLKIARRGAQCLELAARKPYPDLILLDIEMPGMNGYEVCRCLKENPITSSIPVIFVTAHRDRESEEHGFSLGAVDYIIKPIHPAIVLARVSSHVTLKMQRDKLEYLALHDHLTGLYNRHYLLDVSQQKVARAIRYRQPLSLLMLDIDHFKKINDIYGHPTGDSILKQVAKCMSSLSRKDDVIARWGGEEFIILLDGCNSAEAFIKAQGIREAIEQLKPEGLNVTVSIGVGEFDKEDDLSPMLSRADIAMYQAKEQGRNRVIEYSNTMS